MKAKLFPYLSSKITRFAWVLKVGLGQSESRKSRGLGNCEHNLCTQPVGALQSTRVACVISKKCISRYRLFTLRYTSPKETRPIYSGGSGKCSNLTFLLRSLYAFKAYLFPQRFANFGLQGWGGKKIFISRTMIFWGLAVLSKQVGCLIKRFHTTF